MPLLTEIAYAKINLALHVREKMPNGYHALETIFAFAADGDHLTAEPIDQSQDKLSIIGPFAEGLEADKNNLVLRAVVALRTAYPDKIPSAFNIILDKRLPIAAGIGGGSADAAAILRMLGKHYNIGHNDLLALAAKLGADVPACVDSHLIRGEGVGEKLTPIADSSLKNTPLLLVNPRVSCSTPLIFEKWDGVDRGPLAEGNVLEAARSGRNDLEPPAEKLIPIIGEVIRKLKAQKGVRFARMSGSGATCFALFNTQKDCRKAALDLSSEHPEWWFMTSTLC
ncbi:4-(cytidine 5'-diphospho)-2-C-methyl-D-erythritol kinase [Zymomonas mobilis]|uniref:4-diphosphocytidyl-2-C-methyl-D-erythritol kinase n=1 Tax=Zymomonas mobilis subsp. pomaceae (strain ATCC 29192 / DSM 22645 / JCM 10191 / CCUG 17912 / NBRC 13757 / NCIMB 11200 / NRRL B-4491 / Barker I) TaxID=579138 RepID=F8ETL3_ZYMMT|nr:4-(cytidine 5'-diphospho)-2-C-methyl-D-erythritol kinase [Zymomonas mobilis]AEI37023.1 4-diphosphocytidyl-2C-methyl-D-erythritol kinase [Zymomonas mobilis subsp. pomaceae ATCC 29192]MDX5948395.1 4-(cytidine 5'-diphospho)-2-C-methyl-D-erythritol kinase [Zymomonas mobilis subsp. pomaceae]GEB89615.1 4-diphosphocytidyl-2-C-methyl-D-erythritol kinase [Zymomonas mobilis subsp. pomaceae]